MSTTSSSRRLLKNSVIHRWKKSSSSTKSSHHAGSGQLSASGAVAVSGAVLYWMMEGTAETRMHSTHPSSSRNNNRHDNNRDSSNHWQMSTGSVSPGLSSLLDSASSASSALILPRFIERHEHLLGRSTVYRSTLAPTTCEASVDSASHMNNKEFDVTSSDDSAADGSALSDEEETGYSEAKRFYQNLAYHCDLLPDYERRWPNEAQGKTDEFTTTAWPRNVPEPDEISALEFDLQFCRRIAGDDFDPKQCQDVQFRIASYYLSSQNVVLEKQGLGMVRELASQEHADGMCLYGIILAHGSVAGLEPDPKQAARWWRRCVDLYRHITATYELAVALYTGDGVAEDTALAVTLFRRAAHLGHAGAAYMLGECLLDGVGVMERDRGDALEWLVTAAELGHGLARVRVFTLLKEEYQLLALSEEEEQRRKQREAEKWIYENDHDEGVVVNIERRYSVGGGSKNPVILAKRRTAVAESRGAPAPQYPRNAPA